MSGTTFDALAAAGTLREAGFGDRQAEAVAGVVRHATRLRGRRFADRDAFGTKAGLDTGLAAVRADIATLEARLTVRMVAMGGVLVAVMAGLNLFG